MKTTIALIMTLALVAGCSTSDHYTSLTKEQTARMVADDVSRRDFTIDVERAMPLRGRSIHLNGAYSLRISGDSLISHLPYYGRAYSVPYGGGEGMVFTSTIDDYRVTAGRKGESEVTFTCRTREDNFQFRITFWPTGSTDIYVQPGNRQSITYSGKLRLDQPAR